MVGDRDRLRLVLHDQHGVALVAQLQQQVVHPLDVVRVQPDRRLVEDVGDVGERRPEVADHLGALRLAARKCAGGPVKREVAQPDLHERVEGPLQRFEQRRHRRLLEAARPCGQVADLHRAGVGDVDASYPRGPGGRVEPGTAALRTVGERHRPVHEGPDVRLQRVDVLGQHRLLDPRDQTLVGQVDPVDLDLGRLLVEQVVQLLLGVLANRLVRVEEAAAAEDSAVPAVHAVARDGQRTLVERLAVVVQRRQVEVGDRAHSLAAGAHTAVVDDVAHHDPLPLALVEGHRPARFPGRDVERVGSWRPDVRLSEPAEEDTQHRVGVGGGADGGAGVGAHPLLVDDDRCRQAVEHVDLGPRQRRHEALHEGAVSLVDHPLRLRGDRVEHQRALARAGDAGEHRQPALRDLDADVLEVVHARAPHADQVVAVGGLLAGGGHVRNPLFAWRRFVRESGRASQVAHLVT